jgi:hypothetical protein
VIITDTFIKLATGFITIFGSVIVIILIVEIIRMDKMKKDRSKKND